MNEVAEKTRKWIGISSEIKPTTGNVVGDKFLESDTRDLYMWSGAEWFLCGSNVNWD